MTETMRLDIDGPVATLTLNRPEKLNALDPDMLAGLEAAADRLDADTGVRVVLLSGAGDRAFCVGADINAWAALDPLDMWRVWIRTGHRVFNRIAGLRQPVVAVLNGYTFGGGLELALTADIRLAAEEAELALPEVTIGAIPGWGGTGRLQALIGAGRARQMIFTGGRVPAVRAAQWGLVNDVFPAEALAGEARALADAIARNAPVSVQLAKAAMRDAAAPLPAAVEAFASALAASTDDGREGVAAFRERRDARFRGA